MALFTVTPSLPNQELGQGDDLALSIEQFTTIVEGTLARRSVFSPFVAFKPVRGTSTLTNEGIGEATMQKLIKGTAPDATVTEFARVNMTVDTTTLIRDWLAQIDDFQKNYNVKAELGREHGQKMAKWIDEVIAIQAYKAARLTQSAFGPLPGHQAGTTLVTSNANDSLDPAILYSNIGKLLAKMAEKDVDAQADNVMCALRPQSFYALSDADQIVDGSYTTANGDTITTKLIKAWGIPAVMTTNMPDTAITGHFLSNARNGNAYDADMTKLDALLFSPRALLAGETVPVSSSVYWDEKSKGYFVDTWTAIGAAPNRAEFAAAILKP